MIESLELQDAKHLVSCLSKQDAHKTIFSFSNYREREFKNITESYSESVVWSELKTDKQTIVSLLKYERISIERSIEIERYNDDNYIVIVNKNYLN